MTKEGEEGPLPEPMGMGRGWPGEGPVRENKGRGPRGNGSVCHKTRNSEGAAGGFLGRRRLEGGGIGAGDRTTAQEGL